MMFNPNEHMIQLKGKDYLQVMWRLVWFREDHPDYGLETVLIENDEEHAIFMARITDESGRVLSMGHGSERIVDFGDFLEKAETKAVGRALAMLGYGTQFAADELDEGERIVDSPVTRKTDLASSVRAATPKHVCEDCGKVITSSGKWTADNIAAYSLKRYEKKLCPDCQKAEESRLKAEGKW